MGKSCVVLVLVFVVVLFGGLSSASATPPHPAVIVSGIVNNAASALFKWLWSRKFSTKTAISSRSMMKFESGYTVETVFDGSKLGIEPYSVEVTPSGELFILDSENSNIHKISSSLSLNSRPKLIAGSLEGYTGHVDGRPRDARMNHPKGLTVDDSGNIYIADTMNMAIRKISDAGVTTIAGGKWGQVGGHVDGPSEDAKFSKDFDIVYVPSSCSLLVIDRGNQAIREIQLHDDDCARHEESNFYLGNEYLGIVVLVAAGFFGYMLALLHRRVRALFSRNEEDAMTSMKKYQTVAAYQRPPPKSVRPPLIPPEDKYEKSEEGFFYSLGRLFLNTGSSAAEIFLGLFSRRKPVHYQLQQQYQVTKHPNRWPVQESFAIPYEDEPPLTESTTPRPKRAYPFGTKVLDKPNQFKPSQTYAGGWDGDYHRQQQQQMQNKYQHQYHLRQHTSGPQTYYEQSCENSEIVFGAVQEQDGLRETVVIKAVDYGDSIYNHNNIRPRLNYTSYSHGY